MDRLDRIEAALDDVREELRGVKLAHGVSSREITERMDAMTALLGTLVSQPRPPRRRVITALILSGINLILWVITLALPTF